MWCKIFQTGSIFIFLCHVSGTMANKIETSSKNIKPRINLNHNIDIFANCRVTKKLILLFKWFPTDTILFLSSFLAGYHLIDMIPKKSSRLLNPVDNRSNNNIFNVTCQSVLWYIGLFTIRIIVIIITILLLKGSDPDCHHFSKCHSDKDLFPIFLKFNLFFVITCQTNYYYLKSSFLDTWLWWQDLQVMQLSVFSHPLLQLAACSFCSDRIWGLGRQVIHSAVEL